MDINTFPDNETLRIVDSVRRVEAMARRTDGLVRSLARREDVKRIEIGRTKPESAVYPAPSTLVNTFLIRLDHARFDEQEANNTPVYTDRAKEIWALSCIGWVPETTRVVCAKIGWQWWMLATVELPVPTLAVAPSEGIPAATGTAPPFTPGSATCALAARDGTEVVLTGDSKAVYNSAGEVGADRLIQCKVINTDLWVDVENCAQL